MLRVEEKGDFKNTIGWIKKIQRLDIFSNLDDYGRMGVQALSDATPVDSGLSADSWDYAIFDTRTGPRLEWFNTNVDETGTPIVILIQYGHATRSGGYVQGFDFINPAMQPIFDQIVVDLWKKVIA